MVLLIPFKLSFPRLVITDSNLKLRFSLCRKLIDSVEGCVTCCLEGQW